MSYNGGARRGSGSASAPPGSGPDDGSADGVAGSGAAPRRRITLTRRAAILASVLGAMVLLLAYPLKEYASQRAEINSLREQSAAAERAVAELTEQQRRWQDSAYVKAQARQRLHFVMPGETPYVVIRGSSAPAPRAEASSGTASSGTPSAPHTAPGGGPASQR